MKSERISITSFSFLLVPYVSTRLLQLSRMGASRRMSLGVC
jgi:hypothetical protein